MNVVAQDVDLILSVIVPVYNVEKYLERCIQSILNQKYQVGEIICVDDGATDSSPEILRVFQEKDKRIKIIHKNNGGLVSAKKEGLLHAKGKYITFVDADDWIEPDMYQEMMELLMKSDADIVTSGCIRDYGDYCVTEPENIIPGIYDGEKLEKELLAKMISTDHFYESNVSIHHWNKIYRYDLLLKCQFAVDDSVNVGDDAACVYPCLLNASRIAVIGKSYYHYCLRGDSNMSKKDTAAQHRLLFDGLQKECICHRDSVPNIMEQMRLFEYYILLLQKPECVVTYQDEWLFPYGRVPQNSRVVIYGAGRFGKSLRDLLLKEGYFKVTAWIDKQNISKEIMSPDELAGVEYDIILIGVLVNRLAVQIRQELLDQGIAENKILMVNEVMLK